MESDISRHIFIIFFEFHSDAKAHMAADRCLYHRKPSAHAAVELKHREKQ